MTRFDAIVLKCQEGAQALPAALDPGHHAAGVRLSEYTNAGVSPLGSGLVHGPGIRDGAKPIDEDHGRSANWDAYYHGQHPRLLEEYQ